MNKYKPQFSKLLSRGPKSVPTGKSLSKKEIQYSCVQFGFRLVSRFKRYHQEEWMDKCKERDQKAGIRTWRPKKIKMSTRQMQDSIKQYFKSDEWLSDHSKSCVQLPHLIRSKVESLKKALYSASKIQKARSNFSTEDKKTIDRIKHSRMLVNSTDKNCGTGITSREIFNDQVLKQLKDTKGTFKIVTESNQTILNEINRKFEETMKPFEDSKYSSSAIKSIIRKLREWNSIAMDKGELCSCYAMFKMHKPADENGAFARLISPADKYITVQASNFLHSQMESTVYKNNIILRDSSQLIAELEKMKIKEGESLLLNAADVTALYPSINIEDGIKALNWFMETYMKDVPQITRQFLSTLAKWVLENNYIEFEGVKYHQVIGTAMGTIFSVMLANIFMLWLETPIVEKHKEGIESYKRFLDDIFCAWKGSKEKLCLFKKEINLAHPNIKIYMVRI